MGRTELELEKAPLNGTRRLGAKARARRHAPSAIRGCFRFDPLTVLLSPSPPSSSTSQVDHPIASAIRLGSGAPEATMTRTLDPPKSRPPGPHHSTLASPPNAFLSTQLFPSPPPPPLPSTPRLHKHPPRPLRVRVTNTRGGYVPTSSRFWSFVRLGLTFSRLSTYCV